MISSPDQVCVDTKQCVKDIQFDEMWDILARKIALLFDEAALWNVKDVRRGMSKELLDCHHIVYLLCTSSNIQCHDIVYERFKQWLSDNLGRKA